jgi:hypothetical protein
MDHSPDDIPPPSSLRHDADARLPAAAYLRYQSRADGWSAGRQAAFLAHLADNGVVADAARAVGMSVSGGYALRRTTAGYVFNLGWEAALIIARRIIADRLMTAAINGEEARWVREEGITTYTRQNTKLSLTLLDRVNPARTLEEVMAVASRFDLFLQLVDDGVSAEEMWDYLFDDALPHSDMGARERVRAALLLTEESAGFNDGEGEPDANAEEDAPVEYKSIDGPPRQTARSFLSGRIMPAFDQGLRHANRNHQHTEIIKIPNRDARYLGICERAKLREYQQVRNDKQNRAKPDTVTGKIAAPRHRRHRGQNDAIGRNLNRFVGGRRKTISNHRRQQKNRDCEQFLAKGRRHTPVPEIQPDGDQMTGGKGQCACNHAEFNQTVAQRIKGQNDRQGHKFPHMMAVQRKGHQQADGRHFPDQGNQSAVEGKEEPCCRKADTCNKAGKQPRSFMCEILCQIVSPTYVHRHAELGSPSVTDVPASIVPRKPEGREDKWTLKHVQGDDNSTFKCLAKQETPSAQAECN